MFKKFLNAILFGALILGSAGTITSCKDYDDEIDEINQKLGNLSSKDELTAQIGALSNSISAAQSAATQASTEAANALAAAKEAAGVSDQALAAAAQAGGQSGEALTAAKDAAAAAETAAANTKKAADEAAAAAADAVKAAAAGAGSAEAADAASEAAGKAQTAASEASKTAAAAEAAAKTATEQAAAAAEQAKTASSDSAAAKTAAAAAEAKATEAAAQAAVAKEAEAAAQKAAADALKAAADAAEAAKKAADAETLAKAADEASKKAEAAAATANTLAATASQAASDALKLANEATAAAGTAQTTADAAKSLAEAAKAVADAAAKQSDLTALQDRVDDLGERLKTIEDNVDSLDLQKIAQAVKDAESKLASLNMIATAVTSVSIVDSYTAGQVLSDETIKIKAQQGTWANFYYELFAGSEALEYMAENMEEAMALGYVQMPVSINQNPLDLDFTSIIEKDDWTAAQGWGKWMSEYENENPFDFYGIGADLAGAIPFKKGQQVNRPDYFVVRVSPTNAVLTGDMIQLVNSKGESLNEFLNYEVDKFDGYLTRPADVIVNTRADNQETGLWIVKATLKSPYDAEKFAQLTVAGINDILEPDMNYGFELVKAVTRSTVILDDETAAEEESDTLAQVVNKILYAVQVNNTAEGAADRFVTSSYDLTLGTSEFQPANRLHFTVNGTRVENINNRWHQGSKSFLEVHYSPEQEYKERVWLPDTVDAKPGILLAELAKKPAKPNATYNGNVYDYVNGIFKVGYANYDNRSYMDMLTVQPGETFTVSLEDYQGWATTFPDEQDERKGQLENSQVQGWWADVVPVPTETAVKAMYVVLDQPNAVESIPSEWNAWLTYDYTGINEVVEGTSIDITVDGDQIISKRGDIIGFRVYAINWDGTLVDPDGRAFYVRVGEEAAASRVDTEIYPVSDKEFDDLEVNEDKYPNSEPAEFALSETITKGATGYSENGSTFIWTVDSIAYTLTTNDAGQYQESGKKKSPAFYPIFMNKKDSIWSLNSGISGYSRTGGLLTGTVPAAVKDGSTSVVTVPLIPNWLAYEDGKTYSGTLTILDKYGVAVESITITMTKVLPTGAPKGFEIKTEQLSSDGVLRLYMTPDSWEASTATKGTMPMEEVFNFGPSDDVRKYSENYDITFDASAKDGDKDVPVTVAGDETLEVVKGYIDSKTQHATTVVYNYGQISTALYDADADLYDDYVQTAAEFNTIYDCIYHGTDPEGKLTYSWDWITFEEYKNIKEVAEDGTVTYPNKDVTKAQFAELFSTDVQYGKDGEQSVSIEFIYGVSTKDSRYNAPLNAPYEKSLSIESAKLISNANGMEEYFKAAVNEGEDGTTISFTQLSDAPNPNADVPSTLVITAKDSYDHPVTISVKMTVLKR